VDDPGEGVYFIGDGQLVLLLYFDEELPHLFLAVLVGEHAGCFGGFAVEAVAGVEEGD